jgi:hypothetical protein
MRRSDGRVRRTDKKFSPSLCPSTNLEMILI